MLSQPLNSVVARPPKRRLPEIDAFRGLAVGLMGMTHGLMWAYFRPVWADHVKYGGIYFCYTAFLLAFGMSLAISALRGGFETRTQRLRTLRRTGSILFAYYLIACGRQAPSVVHSGLRATAVCMLRLVSVLDVHGAGEFLLSFALYLGLVAALGPRLRWLLGRPWLMFSLSFVAYIIGQVCGPMRVPADLTSYWRLLFGAQPGQSRPFPVFPYMPLLVAGMALAKSYLSASDRRNWAVACLKATAILFTFGAALSHYLSRGNPLHWAKLEPVPGIGFLISSGALAAAVFALCARYFEGDAAGEHVGAAHESALASKGVAAPARFLIFIGRNSIWIIVWQYICIQAGLKTIYALRDNDPAFALFLVAMIIAPPMLLHCSQWFGKQLLARTGMNARMNAESVGNHSA